jgi:hypothetical protein
MTFPEFLQSPASGWTAFIVMAATRAKSLYRALKGTPLMPQDLSTFIAETEAGLAFAARFVAGDTAEAKAATLHNFVDPKITAELQRLNASPYFIGLVLSAVDLAVDFEMKRLVPAAA